MTVNGHLGKGRNEIMDQKQSHLAFKALHAVYHERDFRVRVNDPTVGMVRASLAKCLGKDDPGYQGDCPACSAGFDYEDIRKDFPVYPGC